jgi:hypothetical protein
MANIARYGFRWKYSQLDPNQASPPIERKRVASGYQAAPSAVNVNLWPGDPVKLVNDGTVALAAAGDAIYGVIASIQPYFDGAKMVSGSSLPGGTTYGSVLERQSFLNVIPVASQVFAVSADDNTTATTEAGYNALIEENADISINQVSGDLHAYPKLDISDHKTATAQCRIIDIDRSVTLDFSAVDLPLLVVFNEVQQAPFVTAGV